MKRLAWSVLGNSQRLDGGAMFGNAPKALWTRWTQPDEHNRIPLSCRTLLVREERDDGTKRHVLFETGIGAFFPPKLRDRFGVQEAEHVLLDNLSKVGVSDAEIDVVVLSHLHFDHAGGLLAAHQEGAAPALRFPTATFVVGKRAFARAKEPHFRDRASFIAELPALLTASGRLEIVEGDQSKTLGPEYRLHHSDGHTPGLMLTEIPSSDGPVVFAADLIPGRHWMHLPITMGYDRYPEALIDEKAELLGDLLGRNGRLYFTHDAEIAMAEVTQDEKGKFGPGRTWETLDGVAI